MIKNESIQRVIDTMRVDEVLGDYINIKKRGANLMANCPFHDEKTPSFVVSPAKGMYKCFGCGKSGNAVTFLMEHEKMEFPEAIRHLARRYNIELEETIRTDEEVQKGQTKESLFILNAYAAKQFQENLVENKEGKTIALPYFRERGFSDKTIEDFQLGYCLDIRDHFTQKALEAGYNEEFLISLGLTKKNEEGQYRDFFKGRAMFPIHNLTGKIVGFGGRVMGSTDKTAKYINSPENELYSKSQVLYGMHLAKRAIPKENYCLLVEGYTDVISLYQAGIENAVASSGTALTEDQLRLVRRFTENLYILYDGDKAGIKAALRGTDLALQAGLNVKLILLPDNNDPDSFVRAHGGAHLKKHIDETGRDIVTFKADLYKDEAGNDPIKKAELTRDIVTTISYVSDTIKQSFYLKECALLMDIDEEILAREVQKLKASRRSKAQYSQKDIHEVTPSEEYSTQELQDEFKDIDNYKSNIVTVEKELCKVLMEYGDKDIQEKREDDNPFYDNITVIEYIFTNHIENFVFESQICAKVFDYIKTNYEKGRILPLAHYLHNADIEISAFAMAHCGNSENQLHNWQLYNKTINLVEHGQKYHQEIDQILRQIKMLYYEKVSRVLMENLRQEIGEEKALTEKAMKHLQIQQAFIQYFRKELGNEIQYVVRKRH